MPIHLPHGKKCAVCLTFDFDALSYWLISGLDTPFYISRGEFGARVGVPRLLALLEKYQIPATFCVPGHSADTYPQLVKRINDAGHEIAHHGYCHEIPETLDEMEEEKLLVKGIESIEAVTGKVPLGYRAPSLKMSKNTVKLLVEHGFRYDSTLTGDDYTPYKCRVGDTPSTDGPFKFGKEIDLIEIPVALSLGDWEHFEVEATPTAVWPGLRAASDVLENWQADFDYMYDNVSSGVMVLVMHPQVIGRGHRIRMLERFIQMIGSKPGVYFTKLIDLANCWRD